MLVRRPDPGQTRAGGAGTSYRFGAWRVDPDLNLLRQGATEHHLEPRVMGVLACLLRRPGELVTTAELLEQVWPDRTVEENAVQQRISHIRRALGDDARRPSYIKTISGRGYQTLAVVEPVPVGGRAAAACPVRLVVVPFRDASRDADSAYLCEGLSDDLRRRLAREERLSVIASTSSGQAGSADFDLPEITDRLGASHVVHGRLRTVGSGLQLAVELIEAETLRVLWTDRYDCSVNELPSVEARIARAILGALELFPVASTQGAEVDSRAYAALLLGRHLHLKDIPAAREQFELALAIEPRFAAAHAAMAWTFIDAVNYGLAPGVSAFPLTQACVAKALAIDPDQSEARLASGVVDRLLKHRFQDALDEFHELLVREPTNERVLLIMISALIMIDRNADALKVAEHWAQVDPLNANAHRARACFLMRSPRPDLAAVEAEIKIIESIIDRPESLTRLRVAIHYGDVAEAIARARALAEIADGLFRLWYEFRAALLADDDDTARALAPRIVEQGAGQAHMQAYAWLILRDAEAAVSAMSKGLAGGQIQVIMALRDNAGPLTADALPWVRDRAEFEPLRRRANLDDGALGRVVVPPMPF